MTALDDAALIEEIRRSADRRNVDPDATLGVAHEALGRAESEQARAWAHWLAGLAQHELGDLEQAVASYRAAVRGAASTGDVECEALAGSSMAISLLNLGRTSAAEREIVRASDIAPSPARAQVGLLAGIVHQRRGRTDRALDAYAAALPALRADGDRAAVARLLVNRATLRTYRGETDAALGDLREAEALAADTGLWLLAAMAAHNLAFTIGRHGEIVEALAAFSRAEEAYHQLGEPQRALAVLEADRCDLLLNAGLARDARRSAERAVRSLDALGEAAHAAEARVLAAQACIDLGELDEARRIASEAAEMLTVARRPGWAALATYVGIRAELLQVQDHPENLAPDLRRRASLVARRLERGGLLTEALHARTFAGRIALYQRDLAGARRQLREAAGARHRGPAVSRAQAWLATALLREADGDEAGARRALTRGLRVVDQQRATSGSTELRAGIATAGQDLARRGLILALRRQDPADVWEWAERGRASSLRVVITEEHAALHAALERRRRSTAQVGGAEQAAVRSDASPRSREPPGPAPDDPVAYEEEVRRLALESRGRVMGGGRVRLPELRRRLDGRVLVELVENEPKLWAAVVEARRTRLVDLGDLATVSDGIDHLLLALRALVREHRSERRSLRARAVTAAAAALDERLVAPLRLPPDVDVVVVPTGGLHDLPWGALPSFAERPLTVAPSASLWAEDRASTGSGVLLACGPDLPAADDELAELAAIHPAAATLSGPRATVTATLAELERARLAHIAAHGTFRADSPMFSSLRLADGALTVYELERLAAVPETVVLPACDAAVSSTNLGGELIGTAAALLVRGVRSVVAPLIAVPDDATSVLTVLLHRELARGTPPSRALSTAASALRRGGEPHELAVAASFVVIGADELGSGLSR